jgi:hypothetical protein
MHRRRYWRRAALAMLLAAPGLIHAVASRAQEGDDLAKAAQNPVAAMISLPLQNDTYFGVGPHSDVANVLNIQPVVSIGAGSWILVVQSHCRSERMMTWIGL